MLNIPGGVPGILKFTNALYEFEVTLMDHQGRYVSKTYTLNLTLNETWYKEYTY